VHGHESSGRTGRAALRFAAVVTLAACSLAVAMIGTAAPAAGASSAPTAGSTAPVPRCPPDCGSEVAGDPLLAPYVAVNPGPGWLALPAADVRSYVAALKRNEGRGPGSKVPANVVAGRWVWETGGFSLLIVLVSSRSLSSLHLDSPTSNAGDLCAASHGEPRSGLASIVGIPHSVSGLCALPGRSVAHGATVVAFNRGDVATLMEITSKSNTPIDPRTAALAAQQQFLALPPAGVLVSQGNDVKLVVFWLCVLVAVALAVVACARRRHSWRGPLDAVLEAFGRRKLALGVSLLAVVGAMAFAMLDSSVLHGSGQYEASFDDLWRNWADGAYLTFAGGYGHIYALDRTLETAPALQVAIAPIARLASGLSFPDPSVVLYPQAFWVAGPLFLGALALPLCAGDRWLAFMGVSDLRRRLPVLAVMAVTLPPIALFGHPEDLIALGCMLYGLVAAMEGRHRATGWWLGVALAFQFFAFLAVPIALVFLKRRQWGPAIVPMVALPLSVLLIPLLSEPSATVRQLLHQRVYEDMGYISPTWHLDPGEGAFIRVLVALAAIPVALVLARILPADRKEAADLVVWVVAALFALRVLEPELVPYFLAPTLALLPISAARGPRWRLFTAGALSVWLNWWLHVAVDARWSLWLLLIGQLVVLGWLSFPAVRLGRAADQGGAAKPATPRATTGQRRPRSAAGVR
jgi:hypothetical protein